MRILRFAQNDNLMNRSGKIHVGVWIAIIIIAGGLGYLLFGRMEKNLVYFVTPTELLAKGALAYDKPVRLGGMVKKGSVKWDVSIPLLNFLLTDGEKEIPVTGNTAPPQMFQEEMGVVVEGKLRKDNQFQADRLMVKHSNEYRPPEHGQKPSVIYKNLVE